MKRDDTGGSHGAKPEQPEESNQATDSSKPHSRVTIDDGDGTLHEMESIIMNATRNQC
jgi:hypothetical protein